jgi:uncharacterized membrane protein
MKRSFNVLRTTLAGGVLFLVPLVVLFIILEKALRIAHKVVAPLAAHIPVESIIGLKTPKLLAIGLILLFCFLSGLLARTRLAQAVINWLETTVLSNLPGYQFMKAVAQSTLNVEGSKAREIVLAHIDEAWQLAFLVERLDNGLIAVFVPDAPNPNSGAVLLLTPDRVVPVDLSLQATFKCLKRLGVGSNALVGKIAVEGAALKPAERPQG